MSRTRKTPSSWPSEFFNTLLLAGPMVGPLLGPLVAVMAAGPISGQRAAPYRVIEIRTEPGIPAFAERFEIHVTLRVPGDADASLPDTLLPSDDVESLGSGTWTRSSAPGDSMDLSGVYPALAFREGVVDLPTLSFELGSVPLGDGEIAAFEPFGRSNEERPRPRPPADVVGGNWNRGVFVGSVALAALILGLVFLMMSRLREIRAGEAASERANSQPGLSPREAALAELDRIRAAGWHRNGRMLDFYTSSTSVLRTFAEAENASWGGSRTSTELVRALEDRWGTRVLGPLASTIEMAERVKFGARRPDAERAEADWSVIRDWIRDGAPEVP